MSRWYMQKRVRRAKGGAHMFGVQNVWENRKRYHDEASACLTREGLFEILLRVPKELIQLFVNQMKDSTT